MSEVALTTQDLSERMGGLQFKNAKMGRLPDSVKVNIVYPKPNDIGSDAVKTIILTEKIVAITGKTWLYKKVADVPDDLDFDSVKLKVENSGQVYLGDTKGWSDQPVVVLEECYGTDVLISLPTRVESGDKRVIQSPRSNLRFVPIVAVVVLALGFFAYRQGLLPFSRPA